MKKTPSEIVRIVYDSLLAPFCIPKAKKLLRNYPVAIKSAEDTVRLLASGYSVARYGDGEISMILDKYSIWFQDYDPSLGKRLREVLSTNLSNPDNKKFSIALYSAYGSLDSFPLDQKNFWARIIIKHQKRLYDLIDKDYEYGCTDFSRFKDAGIKSVENINYRANLIKSIWEGKRLLVIEGSSVRLGIGNDLLCNATSVKRIIIPSKNAWSMYDKILEAALSMKDSVDMVLAIAGPTASVLAYDLYCQGIQTIDLGHLNPNYQDIFNLVEHEKIFTENDYQSQIVLSLITEK